MQGTILRSQGIRWTASYTFIPWADPLDSTKQLRSVNTPSSKCEEGSRYAALRESSRACLLREGDQRWPLDGEDIPSRGNLEDDKWLAVQRARDSIPGRANRKHKCSGAGKSSDVFQELPPGGIMA